MTDAEIATIGKLADMLRTKGVRLFEGGGVKVELLDGAAQETKAPASQTRALEKDPDMCHCGHPQHAHMNALCIHGCESDKCVEPENK